MNGSNKKEGVSISILLWRSVAYIILFILCIKILNKQIQEKCITPNVSLYKTEISEKSVRKCVGGGYILIYVTKV